MNANQSLWYRAPATCWNEALPLGNGRLGAMVDSGAAVDRLWLNEDTLWAGLPGKPAPWLTDERLAAIRAKIAEKKFDEAQELLEDAMPGVNVSPYLSAGDLRIEILDEVTQIRDYTRALDLNTATRAELCTLPGVGETMADRIIADRDANGPFRSPEELCRVDGIGEATLERLREWIWVAPEET